MALGIGGATQVEDISGRATATARLLSAANTDNPTLVYAGICDAVHVDGWNAAAVSYLKLYNKATAPSAADTPIATIYLPASLRFSLSLAMLPRFTLGLGYRLVTGVADADNTAVGAAAILGMNLGYRA